MSGPNGEGLPPHILITDELVERAWDAALDCYEAMNMSQEAWRAALSAVAPDLYSAGMKAGKRLRDTSQEDSDTPREVGTGGSYELDPSGQVQPAEEDDDGADASGPLDQAGQEGLGSRNGASGWQPPPPGDPQLD
jgi:hypothetical protein